MTACSLGSVRSRAGGRRAVAYAAAAVALLVAGAPGVAGAKGGPPTLLNGVTVTSSAASSWMDVRLNKSMTIADMQKSKVVSVSSGGFVTVALLKTNGGASDAAGVLFQRLPGETAVRMIGIGTAPAGLALPAGGYRLYMIADNAASMTIQLNGQPRGLTTIRPKNAAKAKNAMLSVPLVAGQTPQAAEIHDTYTASKPFVVVAGAVFDFRTRHVFSVGSCMYDGQPPAVTIGCPSGQRSESSNDDLGVFQPQPNPAKVGYIAYTYSGPKTLTFGIDYATTGVLNGLTRWNTWIELA